MSGDAWHAQKTTRLRLDRDDSCAELANVEVAWLFEFVQATIFYR